MNKLPDGWKEVTFEESCDLITDFVANGSFATLKKNITYNNQKDYAILLRLKDYSANFKKDFVYIDKKAYEFLSKSKVYPGDIILSNVGSTGSVFIAPDLKQPMSLGPNAVLVRFKGLNKFLYYFIRSKSGQELLRSITSKTTQPKFNKTDLRKLKILLPPLPIQKKIVEKLEKTEKLKQNRKEADKLTKDYLQSVFYQMFGDPIKNEKNWPKDILENISNKITDGEHVTPKLVERGIPYISAKNVNDKIDFKDAGFVDDDTYKKIKKRCFPECGDILITCVGTIGRVKLIDINDKFVFARSVALIKPNKNKINPRFLAQMLSLSVMKTKMTGSTNESTVKGLYLKQINALDIPLPPLPLQEKFAKIVEQVEKMKEHQKESKEEIDRLFNALMQKAFKGELV